jgi:outer membrane lipoprotein-sorting protein
VTAWGPSIDKQKTFNSSESEEQVGFGMGRLDRIIWRSEDYEEKLVKKTQSSYQYRVAPGDAAVVDFSYGIIDVNKSDGTLVRAEFYDADDVAIETDTVSDYRDIAADSGSAILYPMSFVCDDIVNNKKTTMEYAKIEFPASIDDSVFTLDFLKAQSEAVLNQTY